MPWKSGVLSKNTIQGVYQFRQTVYDGIPQNVIIHKIISVNETMPHTDNFLPGDFRIACLDFRGNLTGRLPDKFVTSCRYTAPAVQRGA